MSDAPTIAVTGAAGYIGSRVVNRLQAVHPDWSIIALDNFYVGGVRQNGDVAVEMTLTAPACPVAGEMPGMVAGALADLENIGQATVTLTWDPPWTMDQMSEDARLALGFG